MRGNTLVYTGLFFVLSCAQNTGSENRKSAYNNASDLTEDNALFEDQDALYNSSDRIGAVGTANLSVTNPRFLYAINPDYKFKFYNGIYFLDLFDTSTSRIQTVKSRGNMVVCYFSAGSWEDWRSDAGSFPSSSKGRNLDGWAGEKWLDYRNSTVLSLMKKRIQLAKQKGCDGVDPDNIDGHTNSTGFSLSSSNQSTFLRALATEARNQGLKIGLKNSAETASSLEPYFDWVVAEECMRYNECSAYKNSFGKKGKPVLLIEYTGGSSSSCSKAQSYGASLNYADEELTRFSVCR